jgi:hypothetical protein
MNRKKSLNCYSKSPSPVYISDDDESVDESINNQKLSKDSNQLLKEIENDFGKLRYSLVFNIKVRKISNRNEFDLVY